MLYTYFNDDDVYIKPGILMIDTPLLGVDVILNGVNEQVLKSYIFSNTNENEDRIQSKTLKNGLYSYFFKHKGDGQIIIVDNLNIMPDIDLEALGAKVTTYHKDEKNGHIYGFMLSWRKDLPKEIELNYHIKSYG